MKIVNNTFCFWLVWFFVMCVVKKVKTVLYKYKEVHRPRKEEEKNDENLSCHESGCLSPHYNCTSPMDYNSHHSLHSHIPIHHYTNHTAVTNHSSTLIVLPHLHLIHSPTYKQHTSLHTLRSLVLAPADISERLPFPPIATSVLDPGLPYHGTLNLCLWPRPLPGIVYVSALPLIFLLLPADHCLFDSASV